MRTDDLEGPDFTQTRRPGRPTFLPEPDCRPRRYTVISVDDHIVEPPDMFEGRVSARLAARAPRVVEDDNGMQFWEFDGTRHPNVGFNAVVGRPVEEYSFEPARFDEMRKGAYDIHARLADMDLNGIYASVNFPSSLVGFGGQRVMQLTNDMDLALEVVRAWNAWHLDVWAAADPARIIPCQVPWLPDPEVGAREIRANAERGFKAVTFTEAPHELGLPSLHTGHWDPILRACEETETVVCLHVGSSGVIPSVAPDAPTDTAGALFWVQSLFVAVDWLFSLVPVRFPGLKIALSEGGIGWVSALLDRLRHMEYYSSMYGTWNSVSETPTEVFRRNFWHCAIEDPTSFALRDYIGVDRIVVESDYPHVDSTWPNTQAVLAEQLKGVDADTVCKVTWQNASELFRHPVPENVQRDPDAF